MFPAGTNQGDIDFIDVWLLSPMEDPTPPDPQTVERYNAPYNYTPTSTGAKDAVVRFWGDKKRDDDLVNHVSCFVDIGLLECWGDNFGLNLNFGAPSARGFPREIWSSKRQQGGVLFTHPIDWLKGSVFGVQLEDLKVTGTMQTQKTHW